MFSRNYSLLIFSLIECCMSWWACFENSYWSSENSSIENRFFTSFAENLHHAFAIRFEFFWWVFRWLFFISFWLIMRDFSCFKHSCFLRSSFFIFEILIKRSLRSSFAFDVLIKWSSSLSEFIWRDECELFNERFCCASSDWFNFMICDFVSLFSWLIDIDTDSLLMINWNVFFIFFSFVDVWSFNISCFFDV